MAELKWDLTGQHFYENGVDHGVLYVQKASVPQGATTGAAIYEKGVAWNGLTSVSLSPEGAEPNDIYADNIKYASLMSAEKLNLTIEAYQSPEEFDVCDGSAEFVVSSGEPVVVTHTGVKFGQQPRRQFAFVFRNKVGNDLGNENYRLHIVYGCLASPSERSYETINDSPDAMTLSWDVTTTPVDVTNFKPTALVTIDESKVDSTKLATIKGILFGTDGSGDEQGTDPTLLLPNEIIAKLTANG